MRASKQTTQQPVPTKTTKPVKAPKKATKATQHEPNSYSTDSSFGAGAGCRVAVDDSPAPTILTGGVVPGNNSPIISAHDSNTHKRRAFNSANRIAADDRPAPTVVSGGEVPGSDAPLISAHGANTTARHPGYYIANRMAHPACPAPTIVSGGTIDAPFINGGLGWAGDYARLIETELPRDREPDTGMRLAEVFCGCGGIGLGFRSAGFELAFANDYYDAAASSYAMNLGHTPVVRDIRLVTATDIGGPIDVLTGGFPCVTFSMAGRRMGVTDDIAGKLYLEMCRLIDTVRPRYFVAENVEGMLSANGGNAIKLVLASFLEMGYRVQHQLVIMAEHGVPQMRKRVVFVGVRLDQWRGSFLYPRKTHRIEKDKTAPKWLAPAVSLRDAIGDLPEPTSESHAPNNAPVSDTHAHRMRVAQSREPAPTIVSEATNVQPLINVGRGLKGVRNADYNNGVRDANTPSVTIVSSEAPELHSTDGLRRMTARECARVQSFPDWFEFAGNQADAYRQIGNAVPPLYAKQLATAILEYDRRPIIGGTK